MLAGKKVLVIGLAKSGKAAVELLMYLHADVTVNEFTALEQIDCYDDYVSRGIEMIVGSHPAELFERDFDFVVKNPGINYHKPFILRLKERQIPVYTEIELAFQVSQPQNYIAVTGTNGKTTTVSLIYDIFKNANHNVLLAGNVGTPLCQLVLEHHLIEKQGFDIILEMSNFQLLDIKEFHPHLSTIINLTPDHLDYMDSLDEYYTSKTRIYMNQNQDNYYIENKDDDVLHDYLTRYPYPSQSVSFSLIGEADCMVKDGSIVYCGEKVISLDEIKVVGQHNVQNMMVAICMARLSRISIACIYETLASFSGVEHRIEFVRTLDGVTYYNDSKATNTDATIIALKSFERPVILLMGGFEKNLDLLLMASFKERIAHLICFGDAKDRFAKEMKCSSTFIVKHLEDAVKKAYEIAMQGDVVLLSPSTSSFDEFKSYEQRGQIFKKMVNDL